MEMTRKITIFATMFKYCIIFFAFLGYYNQGFAQGNVTIIAEDGIENLENTRIQRRKNADVLVQGFRIFIGMTSSRADAVKLQGEAQEKIQETYAPQVVYDEPNFKIYIGAYNNSTEADEALAEIRRTYPNAKKIKMPIKAKK